MRSRLIVQITTISILLCGCSGQTTDRLSNESLFDVITNKKPPKSNQSKEAVNSGGYDLKSEQESKNRVKDQEVRGFFLGEDYSLKSKNLVFLRNEPNYKIYKYTKDNNKAGNINLKSVEYSYHDGKLASITIQFNDQYNFGVIKESLDNKYGSPYQRNPYIDEYLYTPNDDLTIYLKYNKINRNGYIYYQDKKTENKIRESDKSQSENTQTEL